MKFSYFFAFLLFLLLVDQTLSVRISPSLTKAIYKEETRDTVFQYAWEQGLDEIKQKFSPQQPNTLTKQIQGLSRIKVYFSNFGYLQFSGPFDDYLDQQTVSAFKTYQKHFNLQVTGDLSDETYKKILLPQFAVPDVNFDYFFTGDMSWPKSGNRWFPKGRNITYGFLPESEIPSTATKVFRDC